MTNIELHAHADVQWVSWHRGRLGIGAIHLTRPGSGETLCQALIPTVGRVIRNQTSAAIEHLCKNCLKHYATHPVHWEPNNAA